MVSWELFTAAATSKLTSSVSPLPGVNQNKQEAVPSSQEFHSRHSAAQGFHGMVGLTISCARLYHVCITNGSDNKNKLETFHHNPYVVVTTWRPLNTWFQLVCEFLVSAKTFSLQTVLGECSGQQYAVKFTLCWRKNATLCSAKRWTSLPSLSHYPGFCFLILQAIKHWMVGNDLGTKL